MKLRAIVGAAALCAISFGSVQAATMTFTGLPSGQSGGVSQWAEDGITATAGGQFPIIGWHRIPDTAQLVEEGSAGYPDRLTFTMDALFNATSFDILPYWPICFYYNDDGECVTETYDNIRVAGLRSGIVVAEEFFFSGETDVTYVFGAEFSNLDTLIIHNLWPDRDVLPDFFSGLCPVFGGPCGPFEIDNVTLNPVPLPSGLLLLLSGLGLAYFGSRRKMRNSEPSL